MNSKMSALVFVIPVVLVIIIGVIAAAVLLRDSSIPVTSVKITNTEFDNQNRSCDFDVENVQSIQLTWEVLPEDATDKTVTFTSTNEKISVSKTGLVEFTEPFNSASIQIKTNDGDYTDTIHINTTSSLSQEIAYDFATGTVAESTNGAYLINEGQLILFIGTTYHFDEGLTLASESENVTIDGSVLEFNNTGEVALNIASGGVTKYLNFTVANRINSLELPVELVNRESDTLNIGYGNPYSFSYAVLPNGTVGDREVEVKFQILRGQMFIDLTSEEESRYIEQCVEGNIIEFTPDAENHTFKMIITAIYNPNASLEYNFVVHEGYNAQNHTQFMLYFNDGNMQQQDKIFIVNNITAQADSNLMDGEYLVRDSSYAIYYRTTGVVVEGNGFTIDASQVHLMEQKYTEQGEVDFVHDNTSLFGLGDLTITDVGSSNQRYRYIKDNLEEVYRNGNATTEQQQEQSAYVLGLYESAEEFVFNNLTIRGNVGKGFTKTNGDGELEYYGFAGLNGMTIDGIKIEFNNFTETNFLVGFKIYYGSYGLTMKDSYFGNNAGYDVYIRRTANVLIEDTEFGPCGHTAVYVKADTSDCLIDGVTEIESFNTGSTDTQDANNTFFNDNKHHAGNYIQLAGDVVFDNWTDGKDPFMQYSGAEEAMIPNAAKKMIVNLLSLQDSGLTLLLRNYDVSDKTPEEALDAAEFNWGLMADSIEGGKINYSEFDASGLTGYKKDFRTDAYWDALQAAMRAQQIAGTNPQEAAQALAKATGLIQKSIWANDSIACVSVNAKYANITVPGFEFADGISYLFLGYLSGSN